MKDIMDSEQHAVAKEFDSYNSHYSETVDASLLVPGMNLDYVTRVKSGHLLDIATETFGNLSDLSVLDIGCGIGNYHEALKGKVGKLRGCDISIESIERARIRHQDVLYDGYDGVRLPYEDGTFDLAFTICVMHHVPLSSRANFVREMRRVIRAGGMALVFEHNPYNPLTRKIVDRCPFDADAVLLKQAESRCLFESSGFSDVKIRSILNFPTFGSLSRRLDRYIGKLQMGAQYVLSSRA
jgi:SAM-dependent methyltransferase